MKVEIELSAVKDGRGIDPRISKDQSSSLTAKLLSGKANIEWTRIELGIGKSK
jgi:hypothetical protein